MRHYAKEVIKLNLNVSINYREHLGLKLIFIELLLQNIP